MYTLFVSYNCGISYSKEDKVETLEELQPKLDQLDKDMLRWYIEKDDKLNLDAVCSIHKNVLDTLTKIDYLNQKK